MPQTGDVELIEAGRPEGKDRIQPHGRGPSNLAVVGALGLVLLAVVASTVWASWPRSGTSTGPVTTTDIATCTFGGVTDDETYYTSVKKAFVGLNPRKGTGGGFYNSIAQFQNPSYGTAPDTNGRDPTRTDLCTCDCKPSPDGLGCVGYGGIAFRYVSLLMSNGHGDGCENTEWSGQMMATDCGAALGGACDENSSYFEFIGEDLRESPGGAAIYSVATAPTLTEGKIGGAFRQANSAVSCAAGLKDKADFEKEEKTKAASCFFKCSDQGEYANWLAYCALAEDTSEASGFKGYGV